jgi:hypothetical protein
MVNKYSKIHLFYPFLFNALKCIEKLILLVSFLYWSAFKKHVIIGVMI